MKYIIMLAIVLGLAVVDFIFGFFKGYVTHTINSGKMRRGGVNKLCELLIMLTACGLEIGIQALGRYYANESLAVFTNILGAAAAILVCGYITIMESVSILENYAEINPRAQWVNTVLTRLRVVGNSDNAERNEKNENN